MLRHKIKNLVYSILSSNTNFNISDFKITTESKYSSTQLKIVYEYDEQYYVNVTIPEGLTEKERQETTHSVRMIGMAEQTKTVKYSVYEIDVTMCPGILSYSENIKYEGQDGITKAISKWLVNLWEDLTISPQLRAIKVQTEEIEKIKEKVVNVPDEYFTVEQGEEIKSRLDKLEEQLAKVLLDELPDDKTANTQIEKLHNEIEVLKQTIHSLKKPGWFKSFITKTMTWLSNPTNQKLLKAGKSLVITMLPEGNHDTPPPTE
ncbi:MAG: hypothetical protein J0L80_16940 [Chitinophagales bacterium]|nr:hypothetical protein [Chitinophagales bacterium]